MTFRWPKGLGPREPVKPLSDNECSCATASRQYSCLEKDTAIMTQACWANGLNRKKTTVIGFI